MAAEGSADLTGILLGAGNPLLDISAKVDDALIAEYGLTVPNAILAEEEHLSIFAKLEAKSDVEYLAGGATQNSIRIAQWMIGAEGATSYIGAIGKGDAPGDQLKEVAAAAGVRTLYHEVEGEATGRCAVCIVEGGERTMVAALAAANLYDVAHLMKEEQQAAIAAAKFFYIAGFFLTVSPPAIQHIAEHAAAEGKLLTFNLSAPFIPHAFKDQLAAAMPYVDILFSNEHEAAAYAEAFGLEDKEDLPAIAQTIAALPLADGKAGSRTVIFTQGSKSTIVATADSVVEYAVVPLPKEALVDTNGAGDAFVGGFLAKLVTGADMAICVAAGHYAARVVIQRSGPTVPDTAPEFDGAPADVVEKAADE